MMRRKISPEQRQARRRAEMLMKEIQNLVAIAVQRTADDAEGRGADYVYTQRCFNEARADIRHTVENLCGVERPAKG